MIRKEAWSFYSTSSGVRLCWKLEEPTGPKDPTKICGSTRALGGGDLHDGILPPLVPCRRPAT